MEKYIQMRQIEAVLGSSSNIVMPLSFFAPLGHGIIGTFELARTLNDIEPNAFILEMSVWLVLMEVTRSFSRGLRKSKRLHNSVVLSPFVYIASCLSFLMAAATINIINLI